MTGCNRQFRRPLSDGILTAAIICVVTLICALPAASVLLRGRPVSDRARAERFRDRVGVLFAASVAVLAVTAIGWIWTGEWRWCASAAIFAALVLMLGMGAQQRVMDARREGR